MRLAHMRNSMPLAATRHDSPRNPCLYAGKPLNKLAGASRYVISRSRHIQVAHADLHIFNIIPLPPPAHIFPPFHFAQPADLHPPLLVAV